MIADVLTSIKAYLYDRTSSPLLGAFATSLALWNFKILMLFFSKTPYAVKVWEIDFFYSQSFFPSIDNLSWLTNYWMCLYLMPAVTSIFYIYVFPLFSHRVFEYSYNKQIVLNNKKKELQRSELVSAEEKEELLNRIEQQNIENRASVIKFREEISGLENQLNVVIQEREKLKTHNDELRVRVHELESREKKTSSDDGDITRQYGSSNDSDFEEGSKTQQPLNRQDVQRPAYINLYESLDWQLKRITEKILSSLLDRGYTFDELCIELNYLDEQDFISDSTALRKLMGKLKLYDIIDVNFDSMGEEYYVLKNDGKALYKNIIENEGSNPLFAF
ncbi:hypothetical protein [Vibrio owensii]|uniref:hypothetical protein n=1 Tax=Vibrio owensii TaxID=696485 RepID=UPI00221EE0DE|nr:hypothetical protein [Vibrio owensii]